MLSLYLPADSADLTVHHEIDAEGAANFGHARYSVTAERLTLFVGAERRFEILAADRAQPFDRVEAAQHVAAQQVARGAVAEFRTVSGCTAVTLPVLDEAGRRVGDFDIHLVQITTRRRRLAPYLRDEP